MAAENIERGDLHLTQSVIVAQGDGAVVVGDATLLYGADFLREGPDLVLRNEGAADIRIVDYFRTSEPADLQSTDGGTLRGHVVERLAGPEAPGQYAQAGHADASVPIGQVESVAGTASVQRADGTTEPLNSSSRIFLGDVVQTVGDSTLSITFADGTIFTLSADSRMVIDELIYAPDGNGNSATFNLVQGGFIFIAGQVARTGGMEVNTPAATMGIRGTTVLADVQTEGGVSTVEVTLTRDPDGGIGRVELFDLSGTLITTITGIDTKWIVSTDDAETREVDRTADDEAADNVLIADAVAAFQSAQSRFAQDGSFVQLDNLSRETDDVDSDESDGGDQIDLDSEDADEIPEIDVTPVPEGPGSDSFDEGRLEPLKDETPTFDVFRTALEDSEEEPVTGQLRVETRLQGEFVLVTPTANGSVTLSSDGSYTYVPNPDFDGVDQFRYAVTGPDGRASTGTVTIDVLPVNDAPVIEDASLGGVEDNVLLGTAVARDIDSPVLTYSLATGAANGTVVVTSTGAWSYRPDLNFEGTDSFDIGVSDGDGAVAVQRVTVTVAGVNDAPIIDNDPVSAEPTVFEDAAPSTAGLLSASDPDAGDSLSWSGSAAGTYGTFTINANGAWNYTLGPAANALAAGQEVTDSFTATVTDTAGASASREVTITVVGGNDAPVAANAAFSVTGGEGIEGTLTATDPDTGDALTFSVGAESGPRHGTLTLESDGSFTYTPDEGYNGLDRFDYIVTDASGATVTARATLSVESGTVNVPGGSQVSVSIYPDPESGPAGLIVATSTEPDPINLNLAFALDRSISITPDDWATQINSVADALEELAAVFGNSASQVDVNIIAYASQAVSAGTFDLTNPDLISAIRDLPLTGGGTNWNSALTTAETFFDSQPKSELNFLYFISDGIPTFPNWQTVLARMTDAETKGYSVEIEAFGIGQIVNIEAMKALDPDPTMLNGPEDLLAAIEASPLFAPELVDLSVRLIADGVDRGEVADESAPGISVEGFDTELALADIAGLAGLLGEENIISVTVGFDLDNDPATSEIELFTSQVFSRQGQAMTLFGTEVSDLLLGSDFADLLAGNGGNDIILGFGGDDTISTGTGLDHVRAGAGNDRIVLDSAEAPANGFANLVDGGAGRDVLAVSFGGDLTTILPLVDLSGIEAIDMENGVTNTLDLTLEDVLSLSDEADTELEALLGAALPESLTVYGDDSDTLTLVNGTKGTFIDTEDTVTDGDGTTFDIYTYVDGGAVLATLAVDSDIAVSVAPSIA